MLKHLEDKRVCPKCGAPLHDHDYLMSQSAEAPVLSARFVAWVVAAVLLIGILAVHATS